MKPTFQWTPTQENAPWNAPSGVPTRWPCDDVIKWKHFPRYWPFVRGIHRSPVNSPHKGQWRGALMFSLIWACINGWVNNREAGDLRRIRAHSDVTLMKYAGGLHAWNGSDCPPQQLHVAPKMVASWYGKTNSVPVLPVTVMFTPWQLLFSTKPEWVRKNRPVENRREVGTRFASLIFANMRLANLVPTSRR